MNLQLWFCIVQATVTGADPKVKVQENPVDLCSWIFVYIEGIHLLLIHLLPLNTQEVNKDDETRKYIQHNI